MTTRKNWKADGAEQCIDVEFGGHNSPFWTYCLALLHVGNRRKKDPKLAASFEFWTKMVDKKNEQFCFIAPGCGGGENETDVSLMQHSLRISVAQEKLLDMNRYLIKYWKRNRYSLYGCKKYKNYDLICICSRSYEWVHLMS